MRILAVVAHPDDEIIGLGGTLYNHRKNGDEVKVVIICEGKSSRYDLYEAADKKLINIYKNETVEANQELSITDLMFLDMPNNRLDGIELLDLVKQIERIASEYAPDVVYTHFYEDLNIDHEKISRATVTACRTLPGSTVRKLLFFETLSSTEHSERLGRYFKPNYFVEISGAIERKIVALSKYKSELRPLPHPRNGESIEMSNRVIGNKVGVDFAEAFMVGYILEKDYGERK